MHDTGEWASHIADRRPCKSSQARAIKQPQRAAQARLSLSLEQTANAGTTLVTVTAQTLEPQPYVALYVNTPQSVVKAGENRGRRRQHDYGVREWFGLYALDAKNGSTQRMLSLNAVWQSLAIKMGH